jgi:hypothetical protein
MPRQKSLLTVIRDLVRQEVSQAIQGLLGAGKKPRRRRRGPGRPRKRRGRPPKGE